MRDRAGCRAGGVNNPEGRVRRVDLEGGRRGRLWEVISLVARQQVVVRVDGGRVDGVDEGEDAGGRERELRRAEAQRVQRLLLRHVDPGGRHRLLPGTDAVRMLLGVRLVEGRALLLLHVLQRGGARVGLELQRVAARELRQRREVQRAVLRERVVLRHVVLREGDAVRRDVVLREPQVPVRHGAHVGDDGGLRLPVHPRCLLLLPPERLDEREELGDLEGGWRKASMIEVKTLETRCSRAMQPQSTRSTVWLLTSEGEAGDRSSRARDAALRGCSPNEKFNACNTRTGAVPRTLAEVYCDHERRGTGPLATTPDLAGESKRRLGETASSGGLRKETASQQRRASVHARKQAVFERRNGVRLYRCTVQSLCICEPVETMGRQTGRR